MNNEGGDVPGHDKNAHRRTEQGHAYKINPTQIFGSEKQGIGTKMRSEFPLNSQENNDPKRQQELVFPPMQQEQLYRQEAIEAAKFSGDNCPVQVGVKIRSSLRLPRE